MTLPWRRRPHRAEQLTKSSTVKWDHHFALLSVNMVAGCTVKCGSSSFKILDDGVLDDWQLQSV